MLIGWSIGAETKLVFLKRSGVVELTVAAAAQAVAISVAG